MDLQTITPENRARVNAFITHRWHSTDMVIRGEVFDLTMADGTFLTQDGEIIGLVTYLVRGDTCEITSLDSLIERRGIGSALVARAIEMARTRNCRRLVVVTTNDNLNAIRFYQKRGFDMARLNRNALDQSRKLKPSIPLMGEDGIPLRHEIEFEMDL